MPGFDINRFVDLQQKEQVEFMCGICHGIYNKPVVVPCCQQVYCEDCIKEWLENNQSCPNDRSVLYINSLLPPPKLILNLLNRLNITCDYRDEGCQHICSMESLVTHLKNECEYNPLRKCIKCGGVKEILQEHSCILTLMKKIDKLASDLGQLQSQVNSMVLANCGQKQQSELNPINTIKESERGQALILDPKSELHFKGPFNNVVTSCLKMTNPSDKRICFKVKTTDQNWYCVRPNRAIIEPFATVTIAFMLQPGVDLDNLKDRNKHKFMVQTVFAPEGDVNQENLWKEVSFDSIMDYRLKCVFDMKGQ